MVTSHELIHYIILYLFSFRGKVNYNAVRVIGHVRCILFRLFIPDSFFNFFNIFLLRLSFEVKLIRLTFVFYVKCYSFDKLKFFS